jgi:hypothetical protein
VELKMHKNQEEAHANEVPKGAKEKRPPVWEAFYLLFQGFCTTYDLEDLCGNSCLT